jgi:hypothetical protein
MAKMNNERKFPGVGGAGSRPDNVKHKVAEAAERQEAYDKLSVKEKIEKLDQQFGVGVGAKKQRAKLAWLRTRSGALLPVLPQKDPTYSPLDRIDEAPEKA